jgi:prepilin-type processing-associated H-X9-DG protein
MQCSNNLKQLALACHSYEGTYGLFPEGLRQVSGPFRGWSFFVLILPYVEQDNLYKQWDFANLQNNTTSGRTATLIKTFICPSDQFQENPFNLPQNTGSGNNYTGMYSATSYAGNHGARNYHPTSGPIGPAQPNGIFFLTGPSSAPATNQTPIGINAVTDGTSNTLLLGEKYHRDPNFDLIPAASRSNLLMHQWSVWAWSGGFKGTGHVMASAGAPINHRVPNPPGSGFGPQDMRVSCYGSGHPGGANFALADGAVRFIRDSITQTTLTQLSTRNGGEVISEDF